MCENPDTQSKTQIRRLEERLLMSYQKGDGEVKADESFVYFNGKAVSKARWREQSLQIGLPHDLYLDVTSRAPNERGNHTVAYMGQKFNVGIAGTIQSRFGPHAEVVSMAIYSKQNN